MCIGESINVLYLVEVPLGERNFSPRPNVCFSINTVLSVETNHQCLCSTQLCVALQSQPVVCADDWLKGQGAGALVTCSGLG